jgi:uncharacterized protein
MKGLSEEQYNLLVPEGTILLGYRGSIAHGTYVAKYGKDVRDDKDLIGVYIGSPKQYLGFPSKGWDTHIKEVIGSDGVVWDMAAYEVRKMIRLLAGANPNVLSLLWLPEHLIISKAAEGDMLIKNRDLFATRLAYKTFCGYACGQLHRMTHPSGKHMGKKRRALVEEFGMDTKNASCLIHILRQGIEFLCTGEMNVVRHDATELLEIKKGEWSLEKVEREAERLFEQAKDALIHSPLPVLPDMKAIENLCVDIICSGTGIQVPCDLF